VDYYLRFPLFPLGTHPEHIENSVSSDAFPKGFLEQTQKVTETGGGGSNITNQVLKDLKLGNILIPRGSTIKTIGIKPDGADKLEGGLIITTPNGKSMVLKAAYVAKDRGGIEGGYEVSANTPNGPIKAFAPGIFAVNIKGQIQSIFFTPDPSADAVNPAKIDNVAYTARDPQKSGDTDNWKALERFMKN
jgi:hypothetical protein